MYWDGVACSSLGRYFSVVSRLEQKGTASPEGAGTHYPYAVLHSWCTPVCSSVQLAAFLGGEEALRKQGAEQGNFTLAFDLHHRRGGSSLYPALQGAQGHRGKHARPAKDYTETQGRCLLILSPPSCTFRFSIYSPLPASHRRTTPSPVGGSYLEDRK